MDAQARVLKRPRGRPPKAYLRLSIRLTLDLDRDEEIIEGLLSRIPRGRRASFVREALRTYIRAGGLEAFTEFMDVKNSGDVL